MTDDRDIWLVMKREMTIICGNDGVLTRYILVTKYEENGVSEIN